MLENLAKLIGSTAVTIEGELYESEPGNPAVAITFSEGTRLRTDYWRLISNKRASISSFDHRQKYGLPSPIDAVDTLKRELQGKAVTCAGLTKKPEIFNSSSRMTLNSKRLTLPVTRSGRFPFRMVPVSIQTTRCLKSRTSNLDQKRDDAQKARTPRHGRGSRRPSGSIAPCITAFRGTSYTGRGSRLFSAERLSEV